MIEFLIRSRAAFAVAMICLAIASFSAGGYAAAIDEEQRAEIEAIVHNYLVENPEILDEMLTVIQKRDEARTRANATNEIAINYDAIFNPGAAYVAGNPQGDVTLVEFFDYTCGFCKQALADVTRLIKEDPNLRVVFIDYPALSTRNPASMLASRASVAAAKQGKYYAYHLKMMGSHTGLTQKNIMRYAGEVGLDVEQLLKDMVKDDTYERIDANMNLARRLGMDGTPSFVIGNQMIPGAQGYQVLKQVINFTRAQNK